MVGAGGAGGYARWMSIGLLYWNLQCESLTSHTLSLVSHFLFDFSVTYGTPRSLN